MAVIKKEPANQKVTKGSYQPTRFLTIYVNQSKITQLAPPTIQLLTAWPGGPGFPGKPSLPGRPCKKELRLNLAFSQALDTSFSSMEIVAKRSRTWFVFQCVAYI